MNDMFGIDLALSGLSHNDLLYPGRCPGLVYFALSGLGLRSRESESVAAR